MNISNLQQPHDIFKRSFYKTCHLSLLWHTLTVLHKTISMNLNGSETFCEAEQLKEGKEGSLQTETEDT